MNVSEFASLSGQHVDVPLYRLYFFHHCGRISKSMPLFGNMCHLEILAIAVIVEIILESSSLFGEHMDHANIENFVIFAIQISWDVH